MSTFHLPPSKGKFMHTLADTYITITHMFGKFLFSRLRSLRPRPTDTERFRSPDRKAEENDSVPVQSIHDGSLRGVDTSKWPTAIEYLPEWLSGDVLLSGIKQTDARLDIKVGKGKHVATFRVHKALLCRYSDYFRHACQTSAITNASFQESDQGIFDLHDDNPTAFELFIKRLYSDSKVCPYLTNDDWISHSVTPWGTYSVETYVMGDKLMAEEFRPFALAHVLESAKYFDQRDIEIIFETTGPHDPLYKFTCCWLRWRCRELPELWSGSRNEILQAERRRRDPGGQYKGLDPRRYMIQHWFQPCCETTRVCEHDPRIAGRSFYDGANRADVRNLDKAKIQRAWIRKEAYGHRRQPLSLLAAVGAFVY